MLQINSREFSSGVTTDWERVLITQYAYIACRASGSRYALGPYNTVDPKFLFDILIAY